jgi:hypothetical protein
LSYQGLTSDDAGLFLRKTWHAKSLHLNNSWNIDDKVSQYFCYVPDLVFLNLTGTHVSQSSVNAINNLQDLEILLVGNLAYDVKDTSDCPLFGDRFLKELNTLKLKELRIAARCEITDKGLLMLAEFPHIRKIELHSPYVTEEGVKELIKVLNQRNVQYFMSNNKNVSNRPVAKL